MLWLIYWFFNRQQCENTEARTSSRQMFPKKINILRPSEFFEPKNTLKSYSIPGILQTLNTCRTPSYFACVGIHDPWLKANTLTDSSYWTVRVKRINITLIKKKHRSNIKFSSVFLEFGIWHVWLLQNFTISKVICPMQNKKTK